MFGIYPAKVRVTVADGRIASARVIPGCWNPGMYAVYRKCESAAAYDDAARLAKEIADKCVGTCPDALKLGNGHPVSDGVYDLSAAEHILQDVITHARRS